MKKIIAHIFSLVFLALLVIASQSVTASDATVLTYTIDEANSGINTWYDAAWIPTNYTFDGIKTITFSIKEIDNSSSIMNVTVGDIVFTNTPDAVVDSNFALGYWNLTYDLGIIAATSWSDLDSVNAQSLGLSTFIKNESTYVITENEIDYQYSLVNIYFADAYQSTYLSYDKASGLLIHARSVVFGFKLDMTLANGGQVGIGTTSKAAAPLSIGFLLAIPVLAYYKNRN